jgi:hypothetical protein
MPVFDVIIERELFVKQQRKVRIKAKNEAAAYDEVEKRIGETTFKRKWKTTSCKTDASTLTATKLKGR